MKILLTPEQVEQLAPYIDRVRAAGAIGTPGMLVGQIRHNPHRDFWTIESAFLDYEHAQVLEHKGRRDIPGATNQGSRHG